LRCGPNKVRFIGLLQPISDAIKLFSKSLLVITERNVLLYYLAPAGAVLLILSLWLSIPVSGSSGMRLRAIYLLALMSFGIYPLFIAG
jgi:NADH:ubiquinone oxidoreductase subunit H